MLLFYVCVCVLVLLFGCDCFDCIGFCLIVFVYCVCCNGFCVLVIDCFVVFVLACSLLLCLSVCAFLCL